MNGWIDGSMVAKGKCRRCLLLPFTRPVRWALLLMMMIGFEVLCRVDLVIAASESSTGDAVDAICKNDATIGWNPKDEHPCTVERMTLEELETKFGLDGGLPPLFFKPLVIASSQNPYRNQRVRDLTRSDNILANFHTDFNVTLSSSNSFSEHRRTVPFQQYLEEVATLSTTPDERSNETWYLFGDTYSKEWKNILQHYTLPPCQACRRDDKDDSLIALSFGIGNAGSGVSWHVHGPGFSEALHGRKHWILQKEKPDFHPDQTSYNWMYYNYSQMASEERPLECTLYPGDLIYFPDMWWHATLNMDDYTAFVSTFTQEHLFVKG